MLMPHPVETLNLVGGERDTRAGAQPLRDLAGWAGVVCAVGFGGPLFGAVDVAAHGGFSTCSALIAGTALSVPQCLARFAIRSGFAAAWASQGLRRRRVRTSPVLLISFGLGPVGACDEVAQSASAVGGGAVTPSSRRVAPNRQGWGLVARGRRGDRRWPALHHWPRSGWPRSGWPRSGWPRLRSAPGRVGPTGQPHRLAPYRLAQIRLAQRRLAPFRVGPVQVGLLIGLPGWLAPGSGARRPPASRTIRSTSSRVTAALIACPAFAANQSATKTRCRTQGV